jgi:hypothetical protein
MSATIGNFYERVSRAIRRGTRYDDDIPGYAADAVRELENNTNWKYMWREDTGNFTISATVNQLDISGLTGYVGVKNVRFIDLTSDADEFIELVKTRRENVIKISSGRPGAFWMITKNLIGVDAYPDKAYAYSIGWYNYSARPLTNTLEWLTIGEDLLIARTIRKMQPILRDDKLIARWQEIENSTMPALLEAEVVSEYDGHEGGMIPFTAEMAEDRATESEFS